MLEKGDSSYCWIFEFFGIWVTYNFILYPKTIAENSYKYNFYDTVEKKKKKKIEIVKFIHHFHITKEMDLNLKE